MTKNLEAENGNDDGNKEMMFVGIFGYVNICRPSKSNVKGKE